MSETNGKPNIYQRLNAIMQEIGYVQKDKQNSFMKFKYVSHDAVTSAIRPFFVTHGVVVTCDIVQQDVKEITTGKADKAYMTSVVAQVSFINMDNPDDRVIVHSIGQGIDKNDLGPGKAVSYAYKYALLKTLALETGDDPESDNGNGNGNGGTKKPTTTSKPDADTPKPQVVPPSPESEEHKQAFDALTKLCAEKFFESKKAMADAGLRQYLSLEELRTDITVKLIQKKSPDLTMKKVTYIRENWGKALEQLVKAKMN